MTNPRYDVVAVGNAIIDIRNLFPMRFWANNPLPRRNDAN